MRSPILDSISNRVWFALGAATLLAPFPLTSLAWDDYGMGLTKNLVRISLAWYLAALLGMLRLTPADRLVRTSLGRAVRWCWTWACIVFVVHVGVAFHYFYDWSHQNAFDRVQSRTGFGYGVFISYTFLVVWCADAATWWISPPRYAGRSRWIDRLLHGFMLFIVFNGTVIYEAGWIRWAGLAGFIVLLAAWLNRFRATGTTRRPSEFGERAEASTI